MLNWHLEVLSPPQRALWQELGTTPSHFTLYGGTALALHLGHRVSMDFDFFSNQPFDPERLKRSIPYLNHAKIVQLDINTLTCRVDRGGEILMSFFGDLDLACVQQRIAQNTPAIYIAALLDLAGTKAAVVQKRAEEKDYIDINALLQQGIDLPTQLAAASIVYKDQFNPLITLKALSYFGDVPGLSIEVKERLEKAVAQVDINRLPALSLPKTTLP